MQEDASTFVDVGFVVLPVLMAGLGLWGVRRAAPEWLGASTLAVVAWMALWAGLALSGFLGRFELQPPPIVFRSLRF